VPDCGNQIVLADNPMAVFDQIFEEIEALSGQRNQLGPATQLAAVRIKRKISKAIEQIAVLRPKMPPPNHLTTSTVKRNKAVVTDKKAAGKAQSPPCWHLRDH